MVQVGTGGRMNFLKKERRRMGGLVAKRAGSQWENVLRHHAGLQGIKVIPIPPACKWISPTKIMPAKSPFDFIMVKNGRALFVDAKSTKKNTFTYSDCDQDQLYWLGECAAGGARAGYIVSFREMKITVFFSVFQLLRLMPGRGLKPESGILLSIDGDLMNLRLLFHEQETSDPASSTGDGADR